MVIVLRDNGLRMSGIILVDMIDRLINIRYDLDGDLVIQIFRSPILIICHRNIRADILCSGIPTDLDIVGK